MQYAHLPTPADTDQRPLAAG
ncbi:MAG: hypothetical protein RL190_1835, partial [Actinomycetota bacterium]